MEGDSFVIAQSDTYIIRCSPDVGTSQLGQIVANVGAETEEEFLRIKREVDEVLRSRAESEARRCYVFWAIEIGNLSKDEIPSSYRRSEGCSTDISPQGK
jgi:hypothetical protein